MSVEAAQPCPTFNCSRCGRSKPKLSRGLCPGCYRLWHRDNFPPNATCSMCGRSYYRRACASPRGQTCSRTCYGAWKVGRDEHNRPTDGATLVVRVCPVCGDAFEGQARQVRKGLGLYCSLQCNAIRRRIDPARSTYPENAWRQREGFPALSRSILSQPDVRCTICGDSRRDGNLVVHHPIPPDGNPDLLKAPWNLVVLCRACHARVHQADVLEGAA